jgi:invasion protein IalB
MPQPTKIAAFLALALACAAPLAAQDTVEETPAPETDTTVAPADPADGLDMGTPIEGGDPAVGQAYTRETFGDWSMRCLRAPEGPDPCQLYQLLLDSDGNAVAEISMFPLPDGSRAAAGATIVAPLETLLTEQVVISIDGGAAKTYPFTFCNMGGCVARVGFTAEDITAFKRGSAATMRIVPAVAPDQTVELKISLLGFTAGFDFQVEAAAEDAPAE